MVTGPSATELLPKLQHIAGAEGIQVENAGSDVFGGSAEVIRARWFLGGRKVVYRMTCRLDESARTVRFHESATEKSWGLPPPGFTVEKTTTSGTRVSSSRTDTSVGGGGHLDYGRVREALEAAARDAGWQFLLEIGRAP